MKKLMVMAIAATGLALAACNNKKAEQPQNAPVQEEVITDSAFQNKAAGEYQSFDGSKSITLGKDFTVTVKNDQEYYKWDFTMQPQGDQTVITLDRKGADKDIQTEAQLDVADGKLIVKNETYRKKAAN